MKNYTSIFREEVENLNKITIESIAYSLGIVTVAFWIFLLLNSAIVESKPNMTDINLDTTSKYVLTIASDRVNIVSGESEAQRLVRVAAEKARADAEAEALAKQASVKAVRYVDPSNFDEIYKRAEARYGVDWRLLRSVHYIETGQSGSTSKTSYSGAKGPMQFLPSTWKRYGVDGNGDGVADITNVEDAIFAAANYLKACGYPNVQRALWGYNPSSYYYTKVMTVANSLGFFA